MLIVQTIVADLVKVKHIYDIDFFAYLIWLANIGTACKVTLYV